MLHFCCILCHFWLKKECVRLALFHSLHICIAKKESQIYLLGNLTNVFMSHEKSKQDIRKREEEPCKPSKKTAWRWQISLICCLMNVKEQAKHLFPLYCIKVKANYFALCATVCVQMDVNTWVANSRTPWAPKNFLMGAGMGVSKLWGNLWLSPKNWTEAVHQQWGVHF